MKRSMLVRLGFVAVLAMGVLSVAGASSAFAATSCYKVVEGEKSNWKFWGNPECLHKESGTSNYILVEGAGEPVAGTEEDVWCYKVAAGEPSSWEDAKCTKAKAEGGFVKVELMLWLVDGAVVTSNLATKTEGELELTDLKVPIFGRTSILCSGIFVGTIGANGEDTVTEVQTLAGVKAEKLICKGVKGACGTGAEAGVITPLNLPWLSILMLDLSGSMLDVLYTEAAENSGQPGYEVECKESKAKDECKGYVGSKLTQEGVNLLGVFSEKELNEEEELGTCSLGGANSASLEGTGVLSLTGTEAGLTLAAD